MDYWEKKKIKQIKLVNFEKQVLSKTWTLKKVIQNSFVKEGFVVTYHQILYWDFVNIKFWKQTRSPKTEPSTTNGVFLLMIYIMKQIQLLLNYLFRKNRSFYEGKDPSEALFTIWTTWSWSSTLLNECRLCFCGIGFCRSGALIQDEHWQCVLILLLYHLWYLQFSSPLKISPRELTWCKLSKMMTRGISTALFSLLHWSARLDRYWRSSCKADIKKRSKKKNYSHFLKKLHQLR